VANLKEREIADVRRLGYGVVLVGAMLAGCPGPHGGTGGGGPHGPVPATVPQLDSVPFRARAVYRRMGMMVDSTRMPFVASLRFLETSAPDSTLVVFGLSFANRVLNFRRDEREFVAAYHVELVLRRDSTFARTVMRDATVRVATAPETMRRDESVVYQELLRVPPGIYNVTVVLRDLNSPAYARVEMLDTIPMFGHAALGGPLAVYDAASRVRVESLPNLVVNPRAMLRFGSDSLRFYVEGYNLPVGTRLAARVLDADSVVLWTDTVALHAGSATSGMVAAEEAGGAGAKGVTGGGAVAGVGGGREGRAAGAAAGSAVGALIGAGGQAGAEGMAASAELGGAAGGMVGELVGGGGRAGMEGTRAGTEADAAAAGEAAAAGVRRVIGPGATAAAAAGAALGAGEGAKAGTAAAAAVRAIVVATGAEESDTTAAAMVGLAAGAGAPTRGGAQSASGSGALVGALVGAGAGAGALAGAGAIGIGAGRGAATGVRGAAPTVAIMTAEFSLPPAMLPLGLHTFEVRVVGGDGVASAPFLVGFSDPWAVKTFRQMIDLLRYYWRPDLVSKLAAAPRAERAAAWREFYRGTDPTPETARHDSLEAYFLRIEQANRRFVEPAGPGWRTDRGEVFVNLGDPDQSYEVPGRNASGIRWEYTILHLVLAFDDPEGTGQYHLTLQSRIDYERALATLRMTP
jgi:GWxTD domain-containing protein